MFLMIGVILTFKWFVYPGGYSHLTGCVQRGIKWVHFISLETLNGEGVKYLGLETE